MPLSLCCRASTLITTTTKAGGGQGRVRCSSRGNRSIHSIHTVFTVYSQSIHRYADTDTDLLCEFIRLGKPFAKGWSTLARMWPGATSCSVSLTLTHARANVMQICSVRVCKLLYALLPYKNSVIFKWVFRKKWFSIQINKKQRVPIWAKQGRQTYVSVCVCLRRMWHVYLYEVCGKCNAKMLYCNGVVEI